MWAAGRKERGKGNRSRRRGRKNQEMVEGLRARTPDLDPISRTPYGPAANKGCIKRPDIRQYLSPATRIYPLRHAVNISIPACVSCWRAAPIRCRTTRAVTRFRFQSSSPSSTPITSAIVNVVDPLVAQDAGVA